MVFRDLREIMSTKYGLDLWYPNISFTSELDI